MLSVLLVAVLTTVARDALFAFHRRPLSSEGEDSILQLSNTGIEIAHVDHCPL